MLRKSMLTGVLVFISIACASSVRAGMTITIDYNYDTNGFFDTQAKRDALRAAADRYENILAATMLDAVGPGDSTPGWRIGFTHPGTGLSYQLSTAANSGSDPLGGGADEYGFGGLAQDTWILYAGGRPLTGTIAGIGGTGTGLNFISTFDDLNGPHHRGLISNHPSNTNADLPVWGGSISFDNDGSTVWHFDPTTASASGEVDFYTIALHEIGHALGLAADTWNQFEDFHVGDTFTGPEALAAYNLDNGASATSLALQPGGSHWADNTNQSFIFASGNPNLIGTVGLGVLQDLALDPSSDFSPAIRRIELTNTDVGQLRDLGWITVSPVPEPSTILFLALVAPAGWQLTRQRFRRKAGS